MNQVELLTYPCLCGTLRQAARCVSRLYEEELRAAGYSVTNITQYALLSTVKEHPGVCQRDIGKMMGLDETTLTRTLRPLLREGLMVAEAGADRREKHISLTEQGASRLEEIQPARQRAEARLRKVVPAKIWKLLMEHVPAVSKASIKA